MCGPLESPSKPKRKRGSNSELKDALEKVPEPLQRFSLTAWNIWSRTPPTPPHISFFLPSPSLPRLAPMSTLLHKPNPANWDRKEKMRVPVGQSTGRKGLTDRDRGSEVALLVGGLQRKKPEQQKLSAMEEGRGQRGREPPRGKGSHQYHFSVSIVLSFSLRTRLGGRQR